MSLRIDPFRNFDRDRASQVKPIHHDAQNPHQRTHDENIACESLGEDALTTAPRGALHDIALRRLESEREGIKDEIGKIFVDNNVIGFATYGEQFNSMHVNQTFTGIAIGAHA